MKWLQCILPSPRAAFLCLVGILSWAGTGPVVATPSIRSPQPSFDFGEADNRRTIEHTFVLHNEGTSTLEISRVRSSCGCTLGDLSAASIPPGETATLTARVNLRGRSGPQRHVITLETNDPEQSRYQLRLAGTAVAELDVRPARVFFGNITPSKTNIQTVELISRTPGSMEIESIESDSEYFRAHAEPHDDGRTHQIHIEALNLPPGRHHATIRVSTTSRARPVVDIPVIAEMAGALSFAPGKLVLRLLASEETVTRYVVVRAGQVRSFELLGVEPPDPSIEVHVTRMAPDGYRIQLSNITPHADLNGKSIRVLTDAEDMREIDIPIEIVR